MKELNLESIKILSEDIDFNKMADALELKANTLYQRIGRGTPELNRSEKKKLKEFLMELYVKLGLLVLR